VKTSNITLSEAVNIGHLLVSIIIELCVTTPQNGKKGRFVGVRIKKQNKLSHQMLILNTNFGIGAV
jgi:hypothetical protein